MTTSSSKMQTNNDDVHKFHLYGQDGIWFWWIEFFFCFVLFCTSHEWKLWILKDNVNSKPHSIYVVRKHYPHDCISNSLYMYLTMHLSPYLAIRSGSLSDSARVCGRPLRFNGSFRRHIVWAKHNGQCLG
jgi:hypothetical protein